MADQEDIGIRIEVTADTRQIDQVKQGLQSLAAETNKLSNVQRSAADAASAAWKKQTQEAQRAAAEAAKAAANASWNKVNEGREKGNELAKGRDWYSKSVAKELLAGFKDQDKAADESKAKTDQLKSAVKGLAAEFPIVGKVFQLAAHPIGIFTLALGFAASKVMEFVEKTNKSVSESIMSEMLEQQTTSLKELAKAYASDSKMFEEGLHRIATAGDSASESMTRMNQRLSATLELQKQLRTAMDALAKARIEDAVRTGKLTPEQGRAAVAGIEGRAAGRESDAAMQAALLKVNQTGYAIRVEEERLRKARSGLVGQDEMTTAESRAEKQAALKESYTGSSDTRIAKLKEERATYSADLESINLTSALKLQGPGTKRENIRILEKEIKEIDEQIALEESIKDKQSLLAKAAQLELDELRKRNQIAREKVTTSEQELAKLQKEFEDAKAGLDIVRKYIPEISKAKQSEIQVKAASDIDTIAQKRRRAQLENEVASIEADLKEPNLSPQARINLQNKLSKTKFNLEEFNAQVAPTPEEKKAASIREKSAQNESFKNIDEIIDAEIKKDAADKKKFNTSGIESGIERSSDTVTELLENMNGAYLNGLAAVSQQILENTRKVNEMTSQFRNSRTA